MRIEHTNGCNCAGARFSLAAVTRSGRSIEACSAACCTLARQRVTVMPARGSKQLETAALANGLDLHTSRSCAVPQQTAETHAEYDGDHACAGEPLTPLTETLTRTDPSPERIPNLQVL